MFSDDLEEWEGVGGWSGMGVKREAQEGGSYVGL